MSKFSRLQKLVDELTRIQTELQEFFDFPPELLAVLQPDGSFQLLTPNWEQVLGWPVAVLQSCCWTEFLHPEDLDTCHSCFLGLLQVEKSQGVTLENRFRCRDGSYRWLCWNFCRYEEGLLYAVVRDISNRQRAEVVWPEDRANYPWACCQSQKSEVEALTLEDNSLVKLKIYSRNADDPCVTTAILAPSDSLNTEHSLLEEAEVGIFQATPEGHFTNVNQTMARIYGYNSPEDLITQFAQTEQQLYVNPNRSTELSELLKKYNILKEFESQVYRKDGTIIWVSQTARAVRSPTGAFLGYEGITIDITRRRQVEAERAQLLTCEHAARIKAEMAEKRFRDLVNGLTDAIVWECDPKTLNFTFVSQSAELILGYPVEQWQSKPGFWVNILHPDDRNWVVAFCREEVKNGRDHEFEYRCLTQNGETVWLRDRVSLVRDSEGQLQSLRGLMVDITQRKEAEVERIRLLEQERANNRAKDDFLATVSHELRTPLTNIKMAIQMLEISKQPQQQHRYMQILKAECTREINLVNNLLDLQKLEAGAALVERSPLNLKKLLPSIVEPFIERATARQQSLLLNLPPDLPFVMSDFVCLERIISELLNNACKYTPSEAEITVTACPLNPTNQPTSLAAVELTVSNSGIEIPTAELNRIFHKFYRVPSNDPWRESGTGLGLALVAKLVDLIGAEIRAQSQGNQVSFILTLPAVTYSYSES